MTADAHTADDPVVGGFDLGEVPTAREIRRFTARAARGRAGARAGALLQDLYEALVAVGIAALITGGTVRQLRDALPAAPEVQAPGGLSLPVLVAVLLVAGIGALLSLAGRLGPVGLGGPEAGWWLDLPVGRRGLLRPTARRLPLLAAGVGALVVLLLEAGMLARTGGPLALSALAGAVVAAGAVLAAALVQTLGAPRRAAALAGDLLVLAAPVAAVLLVVTSAAPADLPTPGAGVVLAGALLVAAGAVVVDRRLDDVPARTLREAGSVTSQALGAVVSLDSRELGRALGAGVAPRARARVSRLRTVRGAASALVTADLVLLRRSSRHVVQVVVAVLLPVLATVVPQLASPVGVLLALLVGGWVAATATAEGARWAQVAPVLDALLPLDAGHVRRLRMLVPAAVMLVWSVVALGAVGRWAGAPADWLVLAVVSSPVWAAAAVRAAYRPSPDWSAPLVSTPAGALPSGVMAVLVRGPDLVALCLLPLWVGVALQAAPPVLASVQLVLSVVAVVVASSTHERPWYERMLDDPATAAPR